MSDINKNTSFWKLTGNYPGMSTSKEYTQDSDFTETNINKIAIKIINTTLEYHVVCSYANIFTSGEIHADWHGTDSSDKHAKLQRHDFFEFYYIVKGTINGIIEYVPFTMQSGDCLLVNRNTRNMYYYSPDCLTISIGITADFFQEHFKKNNRFTLMPQKLHDFILPNLNEEIYDNKDYMLFSWKGENVLQSDTYRYIMNCYEELRKKQPCYEDMLKGYLVRLFYSFMDSSQYDIKKVSISQPTGKELTDEIKRFLDSSRKRVTRKELAAHFHFNGDYLCRIFQENMKQTVHEYNQQVYMKEALSLLQNTNLSVNHIAELLGFSSRSHFYKSFESYYHHPISFYKNIPDNLPRQK